MTPILSKQCEEFMKKTTINFTFDEEKYEALRHYLAQKNINLDERLTAFTEQLYQKHVPQTVKDYLETRSKTGGKK